MIPHPAWIEVDLQQFYKNIAIIRNHIGTRLFCLPIKANAYGHGLCEIGKAAQAAGIDYLGVAHLQEGIRLRKAGVTIPVLVLGAIHEDQIDDLIDYDLEFTISSKFKAQLVAEKLHGRTCRVHLEVDTGMQRTGVRPETAKTLLPYLQSLPNFAVVGIYSHLATADKPQDPLALKQIEAFQAVLNEFKDLPLLRHLANSGGTAYFPETHLDMVRPSLMTFGYLPTPCPESLQGIVPC
ncbi:MAG TPA: alanine racemase, partial [Rhabdochlamydiaceae bacterium]|nr:alanine racemase [Rhabdochlamydiaceae bacterium]